MTKIRLLAFVLAFSSTAFADGAGSTGGGDNPSGDSGAAWFFDSSRTIQACFELRPDFGVSAATAKEDIEFAFSTWENYIERKFKRSDIKLGLTTKISVAAACKGNEDLKFYFGTDSEEVRLVRAKYENPTAFAFKRSYDINQRWGQGWIWFAPPGAVNPLSGFPNWQPLEGRSPLRTMLLHEIGHVLGNSHVSGTIMTERISESLRSRPWDMERIDQGRELAVCWHCPYEWQGSLAIWGGIIASGSHPNDAMSEMIKENFKILTGHEAKTNMILAKVRGESVREGTVLEIADMFEIYTFAIQFPQDPISSINDTRVEDSAQIFKRAFGTLQPGESISLSEKVQGEVNYGSLTTKSGKRLTVILERNLPVPEIRNGTISLNLNADFRLKMLHSGQIRPLFEASWMSLAHGPSEQWPKRK